jgi:hypothetical protein
MSHKMTICCGLVLAGLLVVAPGCSRTPPRVYAPSISASAAGAQAIEMFDANKDGKLSGEELNKCPGLKAAVDQIDPSGQGVTAEMITARIKSWQESQGGLMTVGCMVLHNGQPLEGAEVKFVPEKFLGENMKTASGTTNKYGSTVIMVATPGPSGQRGIPPGFYRVEITKPGLNIPAKYNSDTIFGQEVPVDPRKLRQGMNFDLKF